MYFVHVDQNLMDSNPKYATARRHSLVKTYRIVMNHIFMMNKIIKKQKSPFFAPPLRKLRGGAEKWGVLFFYDLVHHENVVYHNFVGFC